MVFSGQEITNQAWYGAPLSYLNEDSSRNSSLSFLIYGFGIPLINHGINVGLHDLIS